MIQRYSTKTIHDTLLSCSISSAPAAAYPNSSGPPPSSLHANWEAYIHHNRHNNHHHRPNVFRHHPPLSAKAVKLSYQRRHIAVGRREHRKNRDVPRRTVARRCNIACCHMRTRDVPRCTVSRRHTWEYIPHQTRNRSGLARLLQCGRNTGSIFQHT
jgi:hypothetical protein